MEERFEKILDFARPYLNTRRNDIHTDISREFARELVKREGGDEDIVMPAIILHDVGWKKMSPELQTKAFGPKAKSPELNRIHEEEGVKIAGKILRKVGYDEKSIQEILVIIDGHDSRKEAVSLNDQIVKDADKLFRYTRTGWCIDIERFGMTPEEELTRLRSHLENWFFTDTAKKLAEKELKSRAMESGI